MLSSLSPSSIDTCIGPCVRKRNYYIVFHSLDGNKPVKLIYWQRLLQAIHNSSDLNKDNFVGVTLMPTVFGGFSRRRGFSSKAKNFYSISVRLSKLQIWTPAAPSEFWAVVA